MSVTKAKIILRGMIGNDPVFTESKGGKKYCRISVAVSHGTKDDKKTSWFPVYFSENWDLDGWQKGDLVDIEGDIRTSSYEKDGEKRYSFTVFPSNVFNISRSERIRQQNKAELAKGEEFDTNFTEEDGDFPEISI